MQKSTVLEKNDFECIFLIDLKYWWLESGLVDFEKNQTPALLLIVDFFTHF